MDTREQIQKEIRISNIINALYSAQDAEEVYEALKYQSAVNLKTLHDLTENILRKTEE